MEDFYDYNRHYIRVDAFGCIIGGFSDAFREPQDSDICINEKGGYQFRLIIDGKLTEENPTLYDFESRAPLYKYKNNKVVKRSDEEIEADREAARLAAEAEARKPTQEDKIEAQVFYTAMLTNTLMEGEDDV